MAPNRYVSDPIAIPAREEEADFARADLEFCGVDHSGSSLPRNPEVLSTGGRHTRSRRNTERGRFPAHRDRREVTRRLLSFA
jgi:hypothetical protein